MLGGKQYGESGVALTSAFCVGKVRQKQKVQAHAEASASVPACDVAFQGLLAQIPAV